MAHFGLRLGCWQRDCSATNGGPLELDHLNKGTGSSIRVDALCERAVSKQKCCHLVAVSRNSFRELPVSASLFDRQSSHRILSTSLFMLTNLFRPGSD